MAAIAHGLKNGQPVRRRGLAVEVRLTGRVELIAVSVVSSDRICLSTLI
jgi:hypothetical protein